MQRIRSLREVLTSHPCRVRMLSILCTFIAVAMVYISNHAADANIPPWAAAALGGFAAIIPRYESPRDHC